MVDSGSLKVGMTRMTFSYEPEVIKKDAHAVNT